MQFCDLDFPNEWAAIAWMCRNQLGRRNITEAQRDYLLMQEYEAQSKTEGAPVGNRNAQKQLGAKAQVVSERNTTNDTRSIVAQNHGITQNAVRRAVEFGRGLDKAVSGWKWLV